MGRCEQGDVGTAFVVWRRDVWYLLTSEVFAAPPFSRY